MVTVKKAKEFLSLVPPKEKSPKGEGRTVDFAPRPPRLYISGVNVPLLNGKSVGGGVFEATFKCRLVEQGVQSDGGKMRRHYEVEVLGVAE